jgi:hypothetical protein
VKSVTVDVHKIDISTHMTLHRDLMGPDLLKTTWRLAPLRVRRQIFTASVVRGL